MQWKVLKISKHFSQNLSDYNSKNMKNELLFNSIHNSIHNSIAIEFNQNNDILRNHWLNGEKKSFKSGIDSNE